MTHEDEEILKKVLPEFGALPGGSGYDVHRAVEVMARLLLRMDGELSEARRIADNASIDARWPSGNFGGHGFG